MAVAKELRGNLTTPEMEVAIARSFDLRKNVIVPKIQGTVGTFKGQHEMDVVMLRPTGYAAEFEIKLTKSDLKKDFIKEHQHESDLIKEVYYAVPMNLVSECMRTVPKRFGIVGVQRGPDLAPIAKIIREAEENPTARKWTQEEKFDLARLGNMRRWKMQEEWIKMKRNR